MTPDEATLLRCLELRASAVSDTWLQGQFGWSSPHLSLVLASLKRALCVEQDRRHVRITTVGESELERFDGQNKYVPFAGRKSW